MVISWNYWFLCGFINLEDLIEFEMVVGVVVYVDSSCDLVLLWVNNNIM